MHPKMPRIPAIRSGSTAARSISPQSGFPALAIRFFGLIPAAGQGSRMGNDTPKQYQRIGRCTLLEHSVRALMSDPRVARVLIVVAPADPHAAALALPSGVRLAPVGGPSPGESVRNDLPPLPGRTQLAHPRLVPYAPPPS